jgi:hypothetical protein
VASGLARPFYKLEQPRLVANRGGLEAAATAAPAAAKVTSINPDLNTASELVRSALTVLEKQKDDVLRRSTSLLYNDVVTRAATIFKQLDRAADLQGLATEAVSQLKKRGVPEVVLEGIQSFLGLPTKQPVISAQARTISTASPKTKSAKDDAAISEAVPYAPRKGPAPPKRVVALPKESPTAPKKVAAATRKSGAKSASKHARGSSNKKKLR